MRSYPEPASPPALPPRLLRLTVECPRCGKPPRLRIPEDERELARAQAPDTLKQTYQCHCCNGLYPVLAVHYQAAA